MINTKYLLGLSTIVLPFQLVYKRKKRIAFAQQPSQNINLATQQVEILNQNRSKQLFHFVTMNAESNCLQFHSFSAFRRTSQLNNVVIESMAELQAYTQQAISLKRKVVYMKSADYLNTTNPVSHTLIDLIFSIQSAMHSESGCPTVTSALKIFETTVTLLKNICLMIQESLFQINCKCSEELCLSMLFEKGLVETFKLCFLTTNPVTGQPNEQNNRFTFGYLDNILNELAKQDYRKAFLNSVYTLHSGSLLFIDRINFTKNLKYVITNMGKVFTQKTNFITRNLKNVKKSKFINEVVTSSIKTICNYRNEQFTNEQVDKTTSLIFGQDFSRLTKQQFFYRIEQLLRQQNSSQAGKQSSSLIQIFFLYLDMFRVQIVMLDDPELMPNIEKQKETNSSNFYTQEMQKLLKKCPYNGDQCCDCKKCQCVRRNRQSAKLSQEKKRNAVQQLDPLKKRIEQLESRNRQLEEENKILKSIVSQLKNNQNVQSFFNSTIETVSKVLND